MSTLKDFVHHKLNDLPGPVPAPPVPAPPPENAAPPRPAAGALPGAARQARARAAGALKGELWYTQAEAHASVKGWVESDETVDSKLCSKEEFPQG